ncbi:DUF397 domain-containing protein [Streptomyces sp. NPDC047002]|uniref:DUF397 domain-containing protein n=1 Tax=Streptomyces sp. NPDC047002 TaxID=3155475 RepID=UPI003451A528
MCGRRPGASPGRSAGRRSSPPLHAGGQVRVRAPVEIGVRGSKNKPGPALRLPKSSWSTFLTGVRAGELDPRA